MARGVAELAGLALTAEPSSRPAAGRLAAAALIASGLAAAVVLCLTPIENPDLPWHLASARWMLAHRAIPRAEAFSWTLQGKPWVDFEWLTQLVFYAAYALGGDRALLVLKALSFGGIAAAMLGVLSLWELPAAWLAAAAPLLIVPLMPFVDLRPENFSFILFLIQLQALERRRLGLPLPRPAVLLALHVAGYAAWANLHAGFPFGLLACACYGVSGRLSGRRRGEELAWAAAGLGGTLLNPYGAGLYVVLWHHAARWEELHRLIIEWGSPSFSSLAQRGYWAFAVLGISGLVWATAQGAAPAGEHLLLLAAGVLLGSRALRTTSYITLLLFPYGLLAWSRVRPPSWWRRARVPVLAALLAAAAWNTWRVLRIEGYGKHLRLADEPRGARDYLLAEAGALDGLRLYNPWDWGGYLDWALYPRYRTFMDGRYLFTDLLKRTDDVWDSPPRWSALMDQLGVDLVLMRDSPRIVSLGGRTPWRAFDLYALPRPRWALVYFDERSLILVRRSAAPVMWLDAHEYKFVHPQDLRHLRLRLVAGQARLSDVEAEVERHARETGDTPQTAGLKTWLAAVRRGLADGSGPAGADRKPRPRR